MYVPSLLRMHTPQQSQPLPYVWKVWRTEELFVIFQKCLYLSINSGQDQFAPSTPAKIVFCVGGVCISLVFLLLFATKSQDQALANFKFSLLGVKQDLHNLQFYEGFCVPISGRCQFLQCCTTPTIIGTTLWFVSLEAPRSIPNFYNFTHFAVSQVVPMSCMCQVC